MLDSELQEELSNYICDHKVLQVLSYLDQKPFEKLEIWTIRIPSKLIGLVTNRLKVLLPKEPHSLVHVRRVKMEEVSEYEDDHEKGYENQLDNKDKPSKQHISRFVICTKDCIPELDTLKSILEHNFPELHDQNLSIRTDTVSRYPGYTKNQNDSWQELGGWPLIWRGNPKAKKVEVSPREQDQCLKYLHQVVELANSDASSDGDLRIATLIVDPDKDKVLVSSVDKRNSSGNPMQHSIMVAAFEAARLEAEKRRQAERGIKNGDLADDRNYLCLNLHVYTTHEPCIMCSMALIHSRIARLFYVRKSAVNGGIEPTSGAGYSIHSHRRLNWKYEAWKWVGGDALAVDDLPEIVSA